MSIVVTEEKPTFRFDDFVLDVADRQLWKAGARVDLNTRYFDALVLLVQEHGQLVEKNRFFEVVWNDVFVSDSALTQCIKEIRKQLGDDASAPRYIQTVPRHGYRFIGQAGPSEATDRPAERTLTFAPPSAIAWRRALSEWTAGTLGGGFAGLLGGMLYGFGLGSAEAGVGTVSTLMVLIALNGLVGLAGGFGIGLGWAGAGVAARLLGKMHVPLRIAGAALGGLFIGASVKLLGMDAFNLLFGRAPAGITGGVEGALLGATVAFGGYLGGRVGAERWHPAAGAGLAGAVAGVLIPLSGGRLMGGSLQLLAESFGESNLQLDSFGAFFGELEFGPATQMVLGGIEGLIFGACVVGAIGLASRFNAARGRD